MIESFLGKFFPSYKFISNSHLVDKQMPRLWISFFSEMIEHVGNEYVEEFFRCCESILAEDGLFVLQVRITVACVSL